ncbi:MAG: hypothetical protein NWE95_03450 [Candidatus Bathyarchaeota archaeon]|nr:hypothetical protein [Candidatus Bathyarchaeota archaeon]
MEKLKALSWFTLKFAKSLLGSPFFLIELKTKKGKEVVGGG